MSNPNDLLNLCRGIQADTVRAEFEKHYPTKWEAFQAGRKNERAKWIRGLLLVVGLPLAWGILQLFFKLLGG